MPPSLASPMRAAVRLSTPRAHRTTRRGLSGALLSVAVACGSPTTPTEGAPGQEPTPAAAAGDAPLRAQLALSRSTVGASDTVVATLTVTNVSGRRLIVSGSSTCTFYVELRDSLGRTPEPYGSRACTMDLRGFPFEPGASRTSEHRIATLAWSNALQRQLPVAPGSYEVVGVVRGTLDASGAEGGGLLAESPAVPLGVSAAAAIPWPGSVVLESVRPVYTRGADGGAEVEVTVRNAGAELVRLAACGDRLALVFERLGGAGWTNAGAAFCPANLPTVPLPLQPGARITTRTRIAEPGNYRVLLLARREAAGTSAELAATATSTMFAVR